MPDSKFAGNRSGMERSKINPRFNIFGKEATGAKRPERNRVGINNNFSIEEAFLSRNINKRLLIVLGIELKKIRKSILLIKIKYLNLETIWFLD